MSGHTYSAHPYSAKAALEVLRYVLKHGLIKQSEKKGAVLKKKLDEAASQSGIIGDVRGKGLLLGIEFVADQKTKKVFPPEQAITQLIVSEAKKRGLIVYPSKAGIDSGEGDAVIIAPPFTISDGEMEELISIFSETVAAVEKNLKKD